MHLPCDRILISGLTGVTWLGEGGRGNKEADLDSGKKVEGETGNCGQVRWEDKERWRGKVVQWTESGQYQQDTDTNVRRGDDAEL